MATVGITSGALVYIVVYRLHTVSVNLNCIQTVYDCTSVHVHSRSNRKSRRKLLSPVDAVDNAFGCVCLSVCPVRALTFESFDLETSRWYEGTSFELSTSVYQGHRATVKVTRAKRDKKCNRQTHSRTVRLRLGILVNRIGQR